MKTLLHLVRGLPGSGKSTYAKEVVGLYKRSDTKLIHLEADMFHINEKGEYEFREENKEAAHAWCLAETEKSLRAGVSVIVSNTNIKNKYVDIYRNLANELGVSFIVERSDFCFGSIHNVPDDIFQKMDMEFEDVEDERTLDSVDWLINTDLPRFLTRGFGFGDRVIIKKAILDGKAYRKYYGKLKGHVFEVCVRPTWSSGCLRIKCLSGLLGDDGLPLKLPVSSDYIELAS